MRQPQKAASLLLVVFGAGAMLALAPACGPESPPENLWALGTYSNHNAYYVGTDSSVAQYEFRADGTFVRRFDRCGDVAVPPEEHVWRHVGEGAVEVDFISGENEGSSWHVTPGADCNEIRIQPYFATQPEVDYTMGRGEVCIRPEACGPETIECFCETYWCDEPPPECELPE